MLNSYPNPHFAIIRLSSLGDVVLCSFITRLLRSNFPYSPITFFTRYQYRELAEALPGVNEVVIYQKGAGWGFYYSQETSDKITGWDGKFKPFPSKGSVILDLQNNLISRQLTKRLHGERVFRFHRQRLWRWLRIYLPSWANRMSPPLPVPLQYLRTIEPLGVADDGKGLSLHLKPEWIKEARELLNAGAEALDVARDFPYWVAIPGSRHFTKRWPIQYWGELIRNVYQESGLIALILGDAEERELGEEIISLSSSPGMNCCGRVGLGVAAALIREAKLAVGGDTGPMHIAYALGKPSIVLYGSTIPEFGFAPFRTQSLILQVEDLECRPCHPHGRDRCPEGHFLCMKGLDPKGVTHAFLHMLHNPNKEIINRAERK